MNIKNTIGVILISSFLCSPVISHAETATEKYNRELSAYNAQFVQHALGDFVFTDGKKHTNKNPFSVSILKPGDKKKRIGKVTFTWREPDSTITAFEMAAWDSEGSTPWKCFDNFKLMKNKKVVGTFKASDKNNWKLFSVNPDRDKVYENWTLLFKDVKVPMMRDEKVSFELYADAQKKNLPKLSNGKLRCGVRMSIPSQHMISQPNKASESKYKYYYLSHTITDEANNDLLLVVE